MLEELKRCCGYKGHWACAHDYPDHMVPLSRFAVSALGAHGNKDGLQHHCKSCSDYRQAQRPKHPITGENKRHWKHRIAIKRGGNPKSPFWPYYLIKAEDQWDIEMKNYLLDTAPGHVVLAHIRSMKPEFSFPETKESVTSQRTVNHKTRNQALATKLKELYNYTCQVEGCNETEVEIAHIYKHSLPDSVDDETNAWCLCCNHHRAYDANRIELMPYPKSTHALRFIRYNRFGEAVEISRIIYDEKHTVNIKWIKKSREWHDRKK
jgi:hypothetical protein